jgi:hypothetical protein
MSDISHLLPDELDNNPDTISQVEQLTETVNQLIAYIAARDGIADPDEEQ